MENDFDYIDDDLSLERVYGGQEADQHSHPWMCLVFGSEVEKFHCGCVLISDQWVLTTASCVRQ